MKRRVTIHDLAFALNLNASTISRALNNHPKISEKNKKKVLEKAKELGYKPNYIASSLRTGKVKTLGMIVPRINRDFISNVISGAERVCREHGYNLIICQSEENVDREKEVLYTLLQSRVSGIMISISAQTQTSEHLNFILSEGIPVIQFDRVCRDIPTPCVVNDNYQAAHKATQHLIDQGCKNLVHLAGPRFINIYHERSRGFIDVTKSYKCISIDIIEPCITIEKGYDLARSWFYSGIFPDGVLAASDYSALGVMMAAKEYNIKVPEQIAIIGFANEPFTSLIHPRISSIDQHAQEMGKNTAQLLIDSLNKHKITYEDKFIEIRTELIIRESSLRNMSYSQKMHKPDPS